MLESQNRLENWFHWWFHWQLTMLRLWKLLKLIYKIIDIDIDVETMIHIVSTQKPVYELKLFIRYELNPSHWVGQVAKTIEIIEKPKY